jgi:protein-S-isoprenylcysteine O-methyltransferase Ste14
MNHSDQGVARIGFFRPPLVYLAAILIGLGLHRAWPLPLPAWRWLAPLGLALVAASILLFGSAVTLFRAAGTPVPARKPTTAIVKTGPFRFSRNPIYLAFSLLQLGIALRVGSWWLLGTLGLAFALMHGVVVPREERYLEASFGEEYRCYKSSVRRWL